MKFVATIQARMGSSRLPGKVLMHAGGKPFLLHQVERVRGSRLVDDVVIATTTQSQDDIIQEFCEDNEINVFRGSEDDVLGRVATCLLSYRGWGHVELVGDSPYVDPQIIDEFIGYFLKHYNMVDYVSNGIDITYPNGSEINVYLADTLIECNNRVPSDDPMREHVDIHIYKSGYYNCINLEAPTKLRHPEYYIEIDTEKDYQVLKSIGDYFRMKKVNAFTLADIIDYFKSHPEVAKINQLEHRKYWDIKEQVYEK